MVIVFVRKIEKLPDAEKQNIISSLSSSALKRLESKRNEGLYNASLCALSLLSDVQRAALDYTDGGRPFFKDLDTDISISHSASYTAVALSDSWENPVGIDIEDIPHISNNEEQPENVPPCVKGAAAKRLRDCPTRFLTENERLALEGGTPYLNIWTKKEALFKFLKNDSTPLIHLDSTAPELHGAKFVTVAVLDGTVSMLTQSSMREYGTSLPCVKGGSEERGEGIVSQAFLTVCTSTNQLVKIIEK